MPTPIEIADANISLLYSSTIEQLQAEVKATHRRAASNKMLRSGNTIIEVKELCVLALKQFGEAASAELCKVLLHTLFSTPATIDQCNVVAHKHLNAFRSKCADTLLETVNLCGEIRHFSMVEPDLRNQEQHSSMAVSLALDTEYSELNHQRLRAFFGFLQRLLLAVVRFFRP